MQINSFARTTNCGVFVHKILIKKHSIKCDSERNVEDNQQTAETETQLMTTKVNVTNEEEAMLEQDAKALSSTPSRRKVSCEEVKCSSVLPPMMLRTSPSGKNHRVERKMINIWSCPYYSRWLILMRRCFSPRYKEKYTWYKDVT